MNNLFIGKEPEQQLGYEMILPSLYCRKFTFHKTCDSADVDVFTNALECFLKQLES
jgi:hypothetical protein